jgi:ATP-binding cassette subfamily B protein IrtB
MSTHAHPDAWRRSWAQLQRSAGVHAPQLRRAVLALAAAAIIQGLALACIAPLLMALVEQRSPMLALSWLLVLLSLMIVASVLRWKGQGFDYNGDMAAATHALRTQLGEQLRRMPLEQLQDQRSGELNALLLGSVDENLNYVLTIANLMLLALLTPLTAASATLLVDWRAGLLLLLGFPAIVPLYRWRRPAYGRGMRYLASAQARCSAEILEYAQGLPVLRATGCVGARAQALQAAVCNLEQVQTIGQRKGAKPNLIIASVVELSMLLAVAGGAWLAVAGGLSPLILAAVLVMAARFAEPLSNFVGFTAVLELIETALERIEALLAIEPLPQQPPVAIPAHFAIEFDNVSFCYANTAAPVLQQFSAQLPARALTALVGPSGSGKSTLTRLILRHADVQTGAVRIGSIDVRQIPPAQLHALIAVVFQEVHLFDDSVLANIRMARPQASDAEVEAAADAAQCLEFIQRLPQGWHTRLGDGGGRLSGGERQRLSIARALLKDAPIVILDEPTAALDTGSERAVQRAIDALVRAKTVIVIAHRLSTIVAAERILVIEDGQLRGCGRHPELLADCARYRAMWDAQQATKQWRATRDTSSTQ